MKPDEAMRQNTAVPAGQGGEEQLRRITYYEDIFREAVRILKEEDSEAARKAFSGKVAELEAYYGSGLWKTDFEDDEAGLLPPDLKRGILSEDGIYNLLDEWHSREEEWKMRKLLIVIDMQNDFIDGALGTKEAEAIVDAVKEKIRSYPVSDVIATMDTHGENYMDTQEGKYLPVPHCIKGTPGWEIRPDIAALLDGAKIYEKPTFGSVTMAADLFGLSMDEQIEIELIGLCTDICVVSNALLLKASMPEVKISVDPSCCAGVTPEKHLAALETMRSCQIQVTGG